MDVFSVHFSKILSSRTSPDFLPAILIPSAACVDSVFLSTRNASLRAARVKTRHCPSVLKYLQEFSFLQRTEGCTLYMSFEGPVDTVLENHIPCFYKISELKKKIFFNVLKWLE